MPRTISVAIHAAPSIMVVVVVVVVVGKTTSLLEDEARMPAATRRHKVSAPCQADSAFFFGSHCMTESGVMRAR
ncbi:hypothetical protein EJ02DRAFT_152161 [Clathrospora elynae]|uniref:Uncharacterized protein n=1 Tax=Clathrospora elynae TaxID=706981 RepID=A0A6A5STF6_9PLEO|nr:hypothetical protein EJ02DRAFT_152161 [Clathrospora elynae]